MNCLCTDPHGGPACRGIFRLRSSLCAGVGLATLLLLTSTSDALSKTRGGPERNDGRTAPASTRGEPANGPLQIVVSIGSQRVTLYKNGTPIGQSRVSTGVPDHPTPTGVFSIIQKDRYHRSNLYSDAPMPYMERITWSGVALHEGPLPGRPASHGCIRLTHDFALRLWGTARLGARVVVAHNDVVPVEVAHPLLFAPKPKPADPADTPPPPSAAPGGLASVLLSVSTVADWTVGLGGATPAEDPAKRADPAADPDKPMPSRAVEQAKRSGHVSVFISRKEKKLYVRQGFVPLFEVPVEIDRPGEPIGTHVFTALADANGGIRWNLMTVVEARGASRPTVSRSEAATRTADEVISRLHIPQGAIDRIDELVAPGTSLTVSDQGLGPETGAGTDFVVVTGGMAPAHQKPPTPQRRIVRAIRWQWQ